MTKKSLHIRITERRMYKLQRVATHGDKTMTQVIEELLDTLTDPPQDSAASIS